MTAGSGQNHGPFGERNFFITDAHWPYGPGRAMGRLLTVAGHTVNHVWAAGAVPAAWIWVRTDPGERGACHVARSAGVVSGWTGLPAVRVSVRCLP
jgi:hypothetical protein